MNELISKSEKLISTRELAEQLGTSPKVVLENAKKCLPNKKIENGKATYWTESEITILIEQLKCNQVNGKIFPNLLVELKGVERCERNSSISTMQFAKQLGTTPKVVLENARKCLPDKKIENGKPTYWTQAEITVLLEYMKSHTSNNRSVEFNSTLSNTSTELTPALKLKKALELAQEAYEEELAILRLKNEEQEKKLKIAENKNNLLMHSDKTYTISEIAKELGYKSAIEFNKVLYNDKIIFKRNGTWMPYSDYSKCGYFEIKQTILENEIVVYNLRVTQKGREFLLSKYSNKLF